MESNKFFCGSYNDLRDFSNDFGSITWVWKFRLRSPTSKRNLKELGTALGIIFLQTHRIYGTFAIICVHLQWKIYQTWIFWVIRVIIQLAFCFFSFIPPIVLRTFSGQDGRPKTKPHRLASKIHPSLLGAFLKISSLRFVSLRLLY